MNFQARTEPIRLFNISNFPSIVKDELAVLQQRAEVGLPAETRITYSFYYRYVLIFLIHAINLFPKKFKSTKLDYLRHKYKI